MSMTDNPWVLYHGTTSECTATVEQEGLRWQESTYSRSDLIALVKVFYALRWDGVSANGLPTLLSFTRADFRSSAAKPVYLAETAWRASCYATRATAGGETCSAIRDAFYDLQLYLADPAVRDEHQRTRPADFSMIPQWPELAGLGRTTEVFDLPDGERVRWLTVQMASLVGVHARCMAPWIRYSRGVVYAVRIEPTDRESVKSRGPGGYEWHGRIGPERLIGKVQLLENFEHTVELFGEPPEEEIVRRYQTVRLWDSVAQDSKT